MTKANQNSRLFCCGEEKDNFSDIEDDKNSEEGNKATSSVKVKDKTDCVVVWNFFKVKLRVQLVMFNKCALISAGQMYKWCQVCAFTDILYQTNVLHEVL